MSEDDEHDSADSPSASPSPRQIDSVETESSHRSKANNNNDASSLECELAAKEREISQLEGTLNEKNYAIKELKEKLSKQQDYEDIKRELSMLRAEIGLLKTSANGDHKPLELFLIEKTKALQSENAALKAANVELSGSLPRHLIPSFLPPLQNVEAFTSLLGEEIANKYASVFKSAAEAYSHAGNHVVGLASGVSPSRPASADGSKSVRSSDECPNECPTPTPTATPTPMPLALVKGSSNTSSRPVNNGHDSDHSPAAAPPVMAKRTTVTAIPPPRLGDSNSGRSPTTAASLEKLQGYLRRNVERYMNETLNTMNISRCVRELLSVHNIGQRLFAKYVLGLSQGTVSELLSKPKPWDKLTEKGRDSYRKMHAWAADESCIYLLKSLVPRKGKEATAFKQDEAAEERIQAILSEAQKAMVTPAKPSISVNGLRGLSVPMPAVAHVDHLKQEKDDDSDTDDRRRSPPVINFGKMQLGKEDIPPEMVARIYQEELAKLIGQQVEEGYRHSQAMPGFDRSPEDIRQALAIYHQELSRLTQLAGGAVPGSDAFARFAAAGLANGAFLGLPHMMGDPGLPLEVRMRSSGDSNKSPASSVSARDNGQVEDGRSQSHSSAFSLVRPKPEEMGLRGASSAKNRYTGSPLTTGFPGNNGVEGQGQATAAGAAEDLSAAASPLQRMQSITNSLLTQSVTPPAPSTPQRPAKAVLPPITQHQFDQYNNLNTEEIVKHVKEQLSQYSISQRLFGESVLGLSQGSVSDLLARPKPWHMLTQKGREPFIRMKMFLEDDNAVHKLVASQYKIAPEKLMRTGGFIAGNSGPPINHSHHQSLSVANHLTSSAQVGSISKVSPLMGKFGPKVPEASVSPGFMDGHRSSGSTPDPMVSHHHTSSALSALSAQVLSGVSNFGNRNRIGQTMSSVSRSAVPYAQPSVYEMAALTTDLDTQAITTKIKETLLAHNIGQKIFGEVVLGLSQGSVSELLSKPKPWHMLSIKGREPFIRMQIWLTDPNNIEKLQALKNERREANKRRRTNGDDMKLESSLYSYTNSSNGYSPLPTPTQVGFGASGGSFGGGPPSAKKPRILFSDEQKEALRLAFSIDAYPSTATIEFLASELVLSVRTITNWFHNHRMRLKQVSGAVGDDSSGNFGLGRESNFDAANFRVLLNQRLSDVQAQESKQKYSSLYGSSPISSQLYGSTNSCSSPGSSSYQDDDMGTLDLSMPSDQQKGGRSMVNDSDGVSNDMDDDDDDDRDDSATEHDLSRGAKTMGSSRRKPQVTTSSSRRKPAQPKWVDPGLEFSGDEEDDEDDDDLD